MASENIDIRIREDGARVVKRRIEEIGEAGPKAANGIDLLKRALAGISAGLAVRELIRIADTYTNIENRLRTVTQSTAELIVVNRELLSIANATRQSYEGTVEVYTRMAGASKDLGLSQRQLLDFTTSLNQAVAMSGATADEAKAALIQLSQGMGAGALRGDEFRSVMEQLPTVADVIAQHFNVSRGQLRQFAEDGKITADSIIAAFSEAREEIGGRFANSIPTIGQAFTVLKNQLTATMGEFLKSSGIARAFAEALLFIANNMDPILRTLGALAITLGVTLAAQAIPKAIAAFNALTLAMARNPLGALAVAITFVVSSLIAFSDQIQVGGGHLANLQDLAQAVWESMKYGIETVATFFRENFGWIATLAREAFGDIDFSLAGFMKVAATVVDAVVGFFIGAYRAIVAAFSGLPAALGDIFKRALNGIIGLVEAAINGIIASINTVTSFAGIGEISPVQIQRAELSGQSLGQAVGDAFNSGLEFSGARNAVDGVLARADQIVAERRKREQAEAAAESAAQAALNNRGTARPGAADDGDAKKRSRALQQLQGELEGILRVVDPVRAGLLNLAKDEDTLNKAVAAGLITREQQIAYLKTLREEANFDIMGNVLSTVDPVRVAMHDLARDEQLLKDARQAGLITVDQEIQYLQRLRQSYEEAVDPLKHMQTELGKELELAKMGSREREIERDLRQRILDLQRAGVNLTPAETEALRQQLVVLQQTNEQMAIRDQLLADSVEKRRTDAMQMQEIQALLQDPTSGFTSNDAFGALNNMVGGSLSNTQGALDAQLAQWQAYYDQIKMMRENNLISETTAQQALGQLEAQMQAQRLSGATQMFGALAQLSRSKNRQLAAIGKAAAVTQATIDGVAAVQAALRGPPGPPWSYGIAAATAAMTASNIAQIMSTSTNGFMTGGSFTVGGTGGADSQMVSFRASPGERVSVATPTQVRKGTGPGASGDSGGGGTPQVNQRIINVLDPAMVGDFLATPEGEEVLVNVMSRNSDLLRSLGQG